MGLSSRVGQPSLGPTVARPATTDMLIPKKNRVDIYSYLFKEGVICAKNDWGKPKHDELDVPNMHVLKLMQSLCSRNLVKNQYSWQWQYYYLTDEGVEYLRDYLHLPPEIVPATVAVARASARVVMTRSRVARVRVSTPTSVA